MAYAGTSEPTSSNYGCDRMVLTAFRSGSFQTTDRSPLPVTRIMSALWISMPASH